MLACMSNKHEVSRRGFLAGVGAGVLGPSLAKADEPEQPGVRDLGDVDVASSCARADP